MTFNGVVNIKQTGQCAVRIDRYDECYQIPVLDAKVVGFLSGRLYPELCGKYSIVSSSGYISEVEFSGKGFWTGVKNYFSARVYHRDSGPGGPLYNLSGQWSGRFQIRDCCKDATFEICDINSLKTVPISLPPEAEQDPWETRKAWKTVLEALAQGQMQKTVLEKSKIEDAQRAMRKDEATKEMKWRPTFFFKSYNDGIKLEDRTVSAGQKLKPARTDGAWKVDRQLARNPRRPFHGTLMPAGGAVI